MIPPSRPIRLRAIARWMKDTDPLAAKASPEVLAPRVEGLDEQMMEAFGASEDSLMNKMMDARTWGTEDGLQSFRMARLTMWQEVVEEFLPPLYSDLESED